MINRLLLVLVLVSGCNTDKKSSSFTSTAQPVFEIHQIAALDPSITESSGITSFNDALFTHSDIRGTAQLLEIKLDGSINSSRSYSNIPVRDWEDIATDKNFLYIGDIGNNMGNKTDLKIYKIPLDQLEIQSPDLEIIEFSFEDQTNFDHKDFNQTSYDVEALAAIDNSLYVFTKDWIGLKSNVYKLDNTAGMYKVSTLTTLDINGLVTGATTAPNGDIILCGYSPTLSPFVARVHFESGIPFLKEKKDVTAMIGIGSQIEGITYAGMINQAATYYLTSEKFTRTIMGNEITLAANLYELRWNE